MSVSDLLQVLRSDAAEGLQRRPLVPNAKLPMAARIRNLHSGADAGEREHGMSAVFCALAAVVMMVCSAVVPTKSTEAAIYSAAMLYFICKAVELAERRAAGRSMRGEGER
jgi:hypothetical protein